MRQEIRQRLIKQIISEYEVETQEQLVELLQEKGVNVTQATISRDIRKLNLVKVPSSTGELKYSTMQETTYQADKKLKEKIQEVVLSIDCVDFIIVIKTMPGNAHVLGVIIDALDWKEKIASICGNDVCVVIARSKEDAEEMSKRFKLLI